MKSKRLLPSPKFVRGNKGGGEFLRAGKEELSRKELLGVPVDNYPLTDSLEIARQFFLSNQFHYIVTLNSLFVLEAQSSPLLRDVCAKASLIIPDSSGIVWANRMLNNLHSSRIAGIDFAFSLCEAAAQNNISIFLLGGMPGVAQAATEYLKKHINRLTIAGVHDGFFSDEQTPQIIDSIKNSGAGLLLVALGMPKQDLWLYHHRNEFSPGIGVGVGGSFDVWAGRIKRAPLFFQQRGLEWVYRLWKEPFRWKRILKLPQFALLVVKKKVLS